MLQYIPAEPVCFIQYQNGEIQDLSPLCGQLEKQRKVREEMERNLTPEQRQLLEQQLQQLEEQRERSRRTFDDLIQQQQPQQN